MEIALQYIKQKKWNKAKSILIDLHVKCNNNVDILNKLGDCCENLDELDLTQQCFQKCIALCNNNYYYYKTVHIMSQLRSGCIYQMKYDKTGDDLFAILAESLYEDLLKKQTDNINEKQHIFCLYDYGGLLLKLKKYKTASIILQNCLELTQNSKKYKYKLFIQSVLNRKKLAVC